MTQNMRVPQPTPTVTRADVERIVHRDFSPDQFQTIMGALDEYGKQVWQRERDRVQLAVLKLAAGSIEALCRHIDLAKCDYRDVLAPAEYPAYSKKAFHMDRLSEEEERRIIDCDWKQYESWLSRV